MRVSFVLATALLAASSAASVQQPRSWTVATASFVEFKLSFPFSLGITTGSDGNVWFTERGHIGRVTPTGVITEFATPRTQPIQITSGLDGNVWFTTLGGWGRITPAGAVSTFEPFISVGGDAGIAAGPDGNIWLGGDILGGVGQTPPEPQILRLTTDGAIANVYPVDYVRAITAGHDGAIWFAEWFYDKIGRITAAGAITLFDTPAGSGPSSVAAAPNGAIWFDERPLNRIARRDPSGAIVEWQLPVGSNAGGVIVGPDGRIWFSMFRAIGSIGNDGVITEIRLPAPFHANIITAGPDGNIWFTDFQNNAIGRMDVASITAIGVADIPALPRFAFYLLAAVLSAIALVAMPHTIPK